MSPTILRFPVNPAFRANMPSRIPGDQPRGAVVRPALAFWNKDARTMGAREDAPVVATPAFLPALVDAIAAAERLYFGAGAFALIGRDYHAGLVMQIARLNAALASHDFDTNRARAIDGAPAPQIASATLLLVAALAASARAVASVAQARARPRDEQPLPNDIAILASGLTALIAAASFTAARRAAALDHAPVMIEFAAVSGDLLKTLTMKKKTAPQFLKLLGAVEDLLMQLDDNARACRPALAS
jgi:hypothetical protein